MEPISFKNRQGHTLVGEYINNGKDWAMIAAHGFPSAARGDTISRLQTALGAKMYNVLTFDFHGSDRSEGDFADKLMSEEVADIGAAMDFLEKEKGIKKVLLIGHSTGATDVALYNPQDERVLGKIVLGVVADLKTGVKYDFDDEMIQSFMEKGQVQYWKEEGDWRHGKILKKPFYDEFFTLSISDALSQYYKPLLIIHGTNDFLDYEMEAKGMYELANEPKELLLIQDADHKFSQPEHFRQVEDAIEDFIEEWVKE